MIEVKRADPEIAGEVQEFVKEAASAQEGKKEAGFSIKMNVDEGSLMAFFHAATQVPLSQNPILFAILYIEGVPAGFVVMQEMYMPRINEGKITHFPYSFIWNLYKAPVIVDESGYRKRVIKVGNEEFLSYMVEWAKDRGHKMLLGNCDPAFKLKAAKTYGFIPKHIVLGMDI